MEYFECGLPITAPYWLHTAAAPHFQQTIDTIHRRMEILNDAHRLTRLDGATFSKHAKILFDNRQGTFDLCTADEIAKFVDFMDDGSTAKERLDWPNAKVVVDSAFVSTHEWEDLRHFGIGGSEAAVVLGISPYQNASHLYYSKIGTPSLTPEDHSSDWIFARGHFLEDKVVSAFCSETGAELIPESRMFVSKDHPCCTANIDAIVRFSDGRIFVFEAKTTKAENFMAWSSGSIPAHYVPQTRQYPAVLNDDRVEGTYIGCMFTQDLSAGGHYLGSSCEQALKYAFVERDPLREEELLIAEETWFTDYVERNDPPPKTGKPSDTNHPQAGEIQVMEKYVASPDPASPKEEWTWDDLEEYHEDIETWLQAAKEKSELNKKIKAVDEKQKKASVNLIDRLGSSTIAKVPVDDDSYYEISNSPRTRKAPDLNAILNLIDSAKPYLSGELIVAFNEAANKTSSSTVFSVKEKKVKK